ncbi:MAG: DUF4351 domain-containing protein [Crocosphaera sp.]
MTNFNITDARQKQNLLQLIETVLVYKLPKINRQEIEKMFSLSDLRETKVYQQALEEGRQEGELIAKPTLILRQISLKIAKITPDIEKKVQQLTPNQLDDLALALFDFSDLEDLKRWLNQERE